MRSSRLITTILTPGYRLYQVISNIKWDYDAPHVSGCTFFPAGIVANLAALYVLKGTQVQDVRPFDFDPATHNQVCEYEFKSVNC